ncbi:MAG TPA: D-alanyl-D-alanine carboxypeptidase [Desulfotomaculum sp.]|nr:D-alanyl-D-alanine carboxypeptidase [Desulfotomaculum sp.]
MHRLWTSLLVFLFILSSFAGAARAASPPQTTGEAVLLMDLRNGQVLYEKEGHRPMYPASTTKMLTAIIALEKSRLDEMVTVPREATLVDGSAIGLQEGEKLTMEDLLYALLLPSANDAAVTIACHIAGSVPAFADLMNEKAREIGARESHFVNSSGLHDPQHYVTAYDLALIARYAMNNPTFRTIVSTSMREIKRPLADRSKGVPQEHLWNINRLLHRYEGVTGVKTGYTSEAGSCLVGSAARNGRELLAVVLHSQGMAVYNDAAALLDYGFSGFKPVQLVRGGQPVSSFTVKYGATTVQALAGGDFYLDFPVGEQPSIQQKAVPRTDLQAPLSAGQKVGELLFVDSRDRELGKVDLVAAGPVGVKLTHRWTFRFGVALLILLAFGLIRVAARRRRWRRVRVPRYLR